MEKITRVYYTIYKLDKNKNKQIFAIYHCKYDAIENLENINKIEKGIINGNLMELTKNGNLIYYIKEYK
jgi:hypothetical protein